MKILQIGLLFFWFLVNSQTKVDGNTPVNSLPENMLIGSNWSLDFSDEFNDSSLNTQKWTIQNSTTSRAARPNLGITDWWWKTANVSVVDGNLVLRVDKQDSNTMYCGSVNSNDKYETKYGYFETRVKIAEAVKGTHTAFWFQGDNQGNIDDSGRDGAEIDVFESAWLEDYTKAVVHIDGYGTSKQANTMQYTTPGLHTGYHTFGFYWTPEFMKIYYDGVLKVTYSNPKWVVQANEYVWLSDGASFGLTGDYFTKLAVGTLTNAYFDYVRIWKSTKTNIALSKEVVVKSFESTTTNGDKLVDGNKDITQSGWVSGLNDLPTWAEIDLGGSYFVNGFSFFTGNNGYNLPFQAYNFQYWNGSSWVNAFSKTGNASAIVEEYFTAVTTNKIRLYITANTESNVRLYELEVYGFPNTPTWTGATNTDWTTATNWSTGIVPNQDSNVTIAGGKLIQPTISTNTTINSLTIDAGAELTVTAPNFTVTAAITNSGTMTVANNSNLIQGGTVNANTGNIIVNRNSNALSRLDYTIWSSPVTNQNLLAFSPLTVPTRFYNYNQTTNLYNVVTSPSTTNFATASGYLIRMPDSAVSTPDTQPFVGVFTGVPNNGTITKAVTYSGSLFGYNMLGNPYPSTIDANAFITANTSKIESTLYFWRKKNGGAGTAYATWNLTGSVGTASGTSDVPNGTIQVGQGFFVKAKSTNTVSFTNAMRLGTPSTQFFKTKQVEKDRIWLNLTTTTGVFSQILIGYIAAATLGVDDFDAPYINDSPIALTSNINDEEYTIQGRPTFDPSDVVALNFKTDIDGDYTIALDHFDGQFATGQDIYLVDSKTGVETDLKAGAYIFTAVAGIDNTRFSLKYQKTLKVDAPTFNENNVRIYKNNGTLYVNSGTVAINNIQVFDIQGRLIAEQKNVKATTAAIKDLKVKHQVLIVKITGEDNNVVSKKVVN